MKKAKAFLLNGALLAASTLLLRFIGVAFNAYLTRSLGEAGMGLLTLTLSVYSFALTFSTSGINLASTRLCSEAAGRCSSDEMKRALRLCFLYALFFGAIGEVSLFALAPVIARNALEDMRTVFSIRVLALSLLPIALSSALSGYFNAVRRVWCNSLNMVLSQAARIASTVAFLYFLAPFGISYACCAVVAGITVSEIFSLAVSFILFLLSKKGYGDQNAPEGLFRRLIDISLPVAFAAYARSGLVTIEHILIPRGLKKNGASAAEALASYGTVHAMALPIVLFPSAVLSAFASLLVPELSEALACGQKKRVKYISAKVLRATALFSIGASSVLAAFGQGLGEAIYSSADAGKYIRLFAVLVPVMYFDTSVDAMLKGIGEQVYSMKVNILDAALSVILVWALVPKLGVGGYIIMVFVTEVLNMLLSVKKLVERTHVRINVFSFFILPLICSAGAAGAAYLILPTLFSRSSQGGALFCCVGAVFTLCLYIGFLLLSGALKRADIRYFKKVLAK